MAYAKLGSLWEYAPTATTSLSYRISNGVLPVARYVVSSDGVGSADWLATGRVAGIYEQPNSLKISGTVGLIE